MLTTCAWDLEFDLITYHDESNFNDALLGKNDIDAVSTNNQVRRIMKGFTRESETLPTLSECRRSLISLCKLRRNREKKGEENGKN